MNFLRLRTLTVPSKLRSAQQIQPGVYQSARSYTGAYGGPARKPTPKAFAGVHFKQPDGELTLKIVQPKFRPVSEKSTLFKTAKDGMLQIRIAATVPGQTSTTGEPRRDYSNAATFTLFAADLPALVQAPMSQTLHMSQSRVVDGAHTGEAKLEIQPLPSPGAAGAAAGAQARPGPAAQYKVTVSEGAKSASATISANELFVIRNLAGISIAWISGWYVNLDPSLYDAGVHEYREEGAAASGGAASGQSTEAAPAAQAGGYSSAPRASSASAGMSSSSMRVLGEGLKVVDRKSGKGPIFVREPPADAPPGAKAEFAPLPSGETFDSVTVEHAKEAFAKVAARRAGAA